MDRVVIKGAKFAAHVGTGEEERSRAQEIEIDIVMWIDSRRAGKSDAPTATASSTSAPMPKASGSLAST